MIVTFLVVLTAINAAAIPAELEQIASPEVKAPKVGLNNFTKHGLWGYYDFFQGLFAGAYVPINGAARGYDCFARALDFGVRMPDIAPYFNKEFFVTEWGNWFGLFFKLLFTSLATYNTMSTCIYELRENKRIQ